jgi:hypothetical protein
MGYRVLILLLLWLLPYTIYSQDVTINLKDSTTQQNISSATLIVVESASQAVLTMVFSDSAEQYKFEYLANFPDEVEVIVQSLLHHNKSLTLTRASLQRGQRNFLVLLNEKATVLKEVDITYKRPVKVVEDTTEFFVDEFKEHKNEKLDELLKKLPGVKVDKNGFITFKGKPVKAVMLNGRSLVGEDYMALTKSLRVEHLKKVQAIDNYDSNPLRGQLLKSNEVILNLEFEDGSPVFQGNALAGIGNDNRGALKGDGLLLNQLASFTNLMLNNASVPPLKFRFEKKLKRNYSDFLNVNSFFEASSITTQPAMLQYDNQLIEVSQDFATRLGSFNVRSNSALLIDNYEFQNYLQQSFQESDAVVEQEFKNQNKPNFFFTNLEAEGLINAENFLRIKFEASREELISYQLFQSMGVATTTQYVGKVKSIGSTFEHTFAIDSSHLLLTKVELNCSESSNDMKNILYNESIENFNPFLKLTNISSKLIKGNSLSISSVRVLFSDTRLMLTDPFKSSAKFSSTYLGASFNFNRNFTKKIKFNSSVIFNKGRLDFTENITDNNNYFRINPHLRLSFKPFNYTNAVLSMGVDHSPLEYSLFFDTLKVDNINTVTGLNTVSNPTVTTKNIALNWSYYNPLNFLNAQLQTSYQIKNNSHISNQSFIDDDRILTSVIQIPNKIDVFASTLSTEVFFHEMLHWVDFKLNYNRSNTFFATTNRQLLPIVLSNISSEINIRSSFKKLPNYILGLELQNSLSSSNLFYFQNYQLKLNSTLRWKFLERATIEFDFSYIDPSFREKNRASSFSIANIRTYSTFEGKINGFIDIRNLFNNSRIESLNVMPNFTALSVQQILPRILLVGFTYDF